MTDRNRAVQELGKHNFIRLYRRNKPELIEICVRTYINTWSQTILPMITSPGLPENTLQQAVLDARPRRENFVSIMQQTLLDTSIFLKKCKSEFPFVPEGGWAYTDYSLAFARYILENNWNEIEDSARRRSRHILARVGL